MSLRSRNNLRLLGAAAVHVLTATGGVLGLLSLLSACDGQWTAAFAWLGAALIVDGVDGPLARMVDVKRVLPRFSGEELDHLVDYITYVTVPAFMVARAEIVPESLRLPLAAVIMLVSLYHFSDTESKTADGYFVGFPAIWNVVVLYCFVLGLSPAVSASIIAICAVLRASEKVVRHCTGAAMRRVRQIIEQRVSEAPKCPRCGAAHIRRYGVEHGLQRYRCVGCRRTFNALTGTPLARLRKKECWASFANSLQQSHSCAKRRATLASPRTPLSAGATVFCGWIKTR